MPVDIYIVFSGRKVQQISEERLVWSLLTNLQEDCIRECSFTVVLVLVQPFVAIICEQLVLPKRGVDKAVYEGRGQVHTSRVHLGTAASEP